MIETLREKFDLLRHLDKNRKLLGAASHRYLSHPVGDEAVLDFEIRTGIELPHEYSEFIRQIGTGMGPGHGLYPFANIGVTDSVERRSGWVEEVQRNNHKPQDFLVPSFEEMTTAHVEKYIERWQASDQGYQYGVAPLMGSFRGGLIISNDGSNCCHVIIHKGELAGTIWSVSFDEFDAVPEGVIIVKNAKTEISRFGWVQQSGGDLFFSPRPHTFYKWVNRWADTYIEAARKLQSGF
ncbi:MAG: SMI1/KNR4 family protein [Cytophagales bacterium]|jgi:hypothetical protein|nr:SMI1/KNR4 family protein [Cytophagales bacterium]